MLMSDVNKSNEMRSSNIRLTEKMYGKTMA